MSKLAEFRAAEKALQEQLSALEALKNDSGLQREIEFEEKLKSLMEEYGVNLGKIIAILDPASSLRKINARPEGDRQQRKPREVKVYRNPHTGETIETKGGNHRQLKEWKTQYGGDVVESWKS
ncbi:transcriptional regulator [Pseudomonas putida]|uniref:histone-like nucleoid-structuring protein, MvaT/MvaU family n=1 Tax=Pseudomonas TaxID=286 RepID=UPI0007DC0832|nr:MULTISPECIES: histone-like nucleoid-structuring protein, MvaT/MvaU family [Pseudomonas]OAS07646.1 transcriptional regulator [Pseudomonas putida]OOV90076.1 transcriptional regulator [Pseudomonas sp. MF6396]QNV69518.1 DNA binding protein [Pseudomonas sp. CFA]